MMRNSEIRILPILAILSVSLLIIAGCGDSKGRDSARDSGGRGGKIPVRAMLVEPRPLENKIFATGTLLANEEVELRPEISGRVTGVFFAEGRPVKKGQLMLKINDSELVAQLKRKEFEEKIAADEERRKKTLVDISGVSIEEYDKALNALKMVQAEKEVIQSQLAETEIRAPFDGVVGLRYVSEGSHITSSTLVATMQDIDSMKIEFSVPEKYASLLKNGTEVMIRSGESQEEYRGTVYAVESKIDLGTRTIKGRAKVSNKGRRLIPGSFARVEITLERIPEAIVIPSEAVIPELAGEKVFISSDGKARAVPVKTGIRTENDVQIIEGLNPRDTLIITGLLQISEGRAVELVNLQGE